MSCTIIFVGTATQPILRDVLGSGASSSNITNLENNILNLHINASPVPSVASSTHSSVPLYRRQVLGSGSNSSGSNSNTQSTSTPDNFQHDNENVHFMDSLFNNKYVFDCNVLSSTGRPQNKNKTTTYADVLSQHSNQQHQSQSQQQQAQQYQQQSSISMTRPNNEKDPFAAIRELCQKPNGFFNNNF